jgi:hypothetical protein
MSFEIERKFLVRGNAWERLATRRTSLRQAYLACNGKASIRIRISDNGAATLTVKSRPADLRRLELEYDIPVLEAEALMKLPPRLHHREGAPRHPLRRSRLGSRCVLRRQFWLDHRRNRVAPRASARRIAAVDRGGDYRAAAILQQLLGAASILLMVAPGRTGADRQAGVNGVSRLGRLASFGGGRVGASSSWCCIAASLRSLPPLYGM